MTLSNLDELARIRRHGTLAVTAVLWACIAIIGVGSHYSDQGLLPVMLALGLAAVPTVLICVARNDATTRVLLGATLPLYPAIMLFQWSGTAWQIDIHMLFFALLATLAALCDWRAIAAGTIVTAVHHLGANLLVPAWVFPNGADLYRVVLHAVILLTEAAVLVYLTQQLVSMITAQARNRDAAITLERDAMAERERTSAEQGVVIDAVGSGLRALSAGDLTYDMQQAFPAGYAMLKDDYNEALEALHRALSKVAGTSIEIDRGASDVRDASDSLSERTEQQAASLEETAAAMDEITSNVRQAVDHARRANGAVLETRTEAQYGGEIVREAITAMGDIERSSAEIGDIISVIDGIAFQTNLLALNAGVEAARAGDAGRGFAVVASEVRALAQRSADAASDVKTKILTSTRQVEAGVALVSKTGDALDRIVTRIGDIAALVADLTVSAEQQSNSLRQVNTAVGDMDRMTQQNAAMGEETAAAARGLASEASSLAVEIAKFKLVCQSTPQQPVLRAAA